MKSKVVKVITRILTVYRPVLECGHLASSTHTDIKSVRKYYKCWSCSNSEEVIKRGGKIKPNTWRVRKNGNEKI